MSEKEIVHKDAGAMKPWVDFPEVYRKAFEEIEEKIQAVKEEGPIIKRKPLTQILDEMDDNIRAAAETARRAEDAAKLVRQAAVAATKASGEAGKRAEEARIAGEKAAESAISTVNKAAAKAKKASSKAIKASEEVLLRIESLEQRLKNVEESTFREAVVVIREISREEAKAEIERLFKEGKVLYYSDIARQLRIDLELVVDICEELSKEGKVRVANNT